MVEIIRIPKLGLSDYAKLVSWEFEVGDSISEGDIVAILESEKASAEIESPADGVLLVTYIKEGEEIAVEVGTPLAVVGPEGATPPSIEELRDESREDSSPQTKESATIDSGSQKSDTESNINETNITPRARRKAKNTDIVIEMGQIDGTGPQEAITEEDVQEYINNQNSEDIGNEIKATPRAKRKAQNEDISLKGIEGSGPQNAITVADIEGRSKPDKINTSDSGSGLTISEVRDLTGVRKTIADRLSKSAREKPHVMGTREIPINKLKNIQSRLNQQYEIEISLSDLLLYLVGKVLEDFPKFNAHFENGEHRLIEEVNVGYAVDAPQGLTVPVIEHVNEQPLTTIVKKRQESVQQVLNNSHTSDDLQGGTFTITNIGVFDMDISYSIINPPQVAILAIGREKYSPIERDGEITLEKVITFSLTIDHRVLDGSDSGKFLAQLADYIKYPGLVFDITQ